MQPAGEHKREKCAGGNNQYNYNKICKKIYSEKKTSVCRKTLYLFLWISLLYTYLLSFKTKSYLSIINYPQIFGKLEL